MRQGQPAAALAIGRFVYRMARVLDACHHCHRIGRAIGPCTWPGLISVSSSARSSLPRSLRTQDDEISIESRFPWQKIAPDPLYLLLRTTLGDV